MENEKDTTLTVITFGSKYFSYVRSPAPSHTQTLSNPFRNLTNKVRGKIFYKEVFLRLSVCVVYYCVFILRLSLSLRLLLLRASFIIASVCIQHIYVYFCMEYDNITKVSQEIEKAIRNQTIQQEPYKKYRHQDQKTRKLMTMHEALHAGDNINRLC